MTDITLTRPDDWHLHLRDGAALSQTVADAARYLGRAIVMPNLVPPVTTVADAEAYRERILAAMPAARQFEPLMTLYLTDNTAPAEIERAAAHPHVYAVKLYPAGATTHSDAGVTSLDKVAPALQAMAAVDLPLLVHGEVTTPGVDIFDREEVFIDTQLAPLLERHPELRVVLEHITTAEAVNFVRSVGPRMGATITAHHLLYNRNHMLVGGIKPHYYCLPILKRDRHQQALLAAATSGEAQFFLGTDSAPHPKDAKEAACGCAGCYTAHAALELYAQAFEQAGALDKLEGFASHFGADFYRLPRNSDRIRLVRDDWTVPDHLPLGDKVLAPLAAGETLRWRVADSTA